MQECHLMLNVKRIFKFSVFDHFSTECFKSALNGLTTYVCLSAYFFPYVATREILSRIPSNLTAEFSDITITILDIIYRLVFYLKYNVSETETSSIYLNQLSMYQLKMETESRLWKAVLQLDDRTMDNVQNCDSYINIPSSETYR
jgi:hypothetical protein